MIEVETVNRAIEEQVAVVNRAAADFEWETVRELATQILGQENLPPETAVDILRQRARAYEYMAYIDNAVDDLQTAVSLADSAALVRQRIEARIHLSFVTSIFVRDFDAAMKLAREALDLALQMGDVRLEADSRMEISRCHMFLGRYAEQEKEAERILDLARESGYLRAKAGGSYSMGTVARYLYNDGQRVMTLYQQALQGYRESGDLDGVMIIHIMAGAFTSNLRIARYHNEQLWKISREIGHVQRQVSAANHLAFFYWKLGLYHLAKEIIEQGLLAGQKSGLPPNTTVIKVTLAECYWGLEDYEHLRPLMDELLEAYKDDKGIYPYVILLSGMAALGAGNRKKAIRQLQSTVEHAHEEADPGSGLPAAALAWLGAAELADGQIDQALEHTRQAISLPETRPVYTPQEIWWWHYRASYEWRVASSDLGEEALLPDELFTILDQARRLMTDFVTGISDEGLRRNYLNKVAINRDITLEWTQRAADRGESLAPFTERETESGSFEEQFLRLVEIGNRLTAERDPQTLPETIRNEFVELSGAERAVVALRDKESELHWASMLGIEEEELEIASTFITPFLDKVRSIRTPILQESEGTVAEGEVPELHLRSVIALPLVSQGRLWGVLYGDMRHIFGRFNDQDLSLLTILANQAAAALENADWVGGLEQKVEQRTAELQDSNASLEERNAELAIINSIQAGLVAQMELQGIYDLIGEKLREIFPNAHSVSIASIDPDLKLWTILYSVERGQRYYHTPVAYVGKPYEAWLDGRVKSRDVYIINENADAYMQEWKLIVLDGTESPKSALFLPLTIGDRVRGYISLQVIDRENAFSAADVRLLTTISNAMSIALENARLFDETQRLYAEAQEAKQQAEESRQIAEEANQAKSSFLANMSHELRTPLNAIIGFTRIVKRKARNSLPEKQLDNLGKVQSSAEHLLGLINTVLDIAKIEAGRMDVIASEYEVETLVEVCLATAEPLTKPGVKMVSSVSPGLPRAYSDQEKIRQILLNLLSNAAKFTHEGEVVLSCGLQEGDEDEGRRTDDEGVTGPGGVNVSDDLPRETRRAQTQRLVFAVRDSGIGMNEEQLARVFEEFQQAESTTSRDYGGTGLGLPISKKLAQLLGGDLTASSVAGEGSTFTLVVPLRYSEE